MALSQPSLTRIGTYGVTKNNPSGNFLTIYWIQTQYILLLGEQVLTIFLCIKRVRLIWNCIVNDVQSTTYSSHGVPCPARDLFPWLNTRVKVYIYLYGQYGNIRKDIFGISRIRGIPSNHCLYYKQNAVWSIHACNTWNITFTYSQIPPLFQSSIMQP